MTTLERQSSSPLTASELLWQRFVMLCAFALGCYQLTAKSLWVDEAASAGFALGGPAAWIADHNMSLYYMLLGGWLQLFGDSVLALRVPSVLCFVATVPLLYRVARASFGVSTARIAIALHVSNAFMLQFAQEARGYMLMLLLVLAAQLALLRLLERPSSLWVLAYGGSLGLAAYAHLFAGLFLIAHVCVLGPRLLRPSLPRRACWLAFTLAAAIDVPLLLQLANMSSEQIGWIKPLSEQAIYALPVIWTGGDLVLASATCLLFVLFAVGMLMGSALERLHTQLCVAWLVLPTAVTLLVSWYVAPVLQPKYLIAAVPALQLGAAATLARVPRQVAFVICTTLFAAAGLRIENWYVEQQKEPWRQVVLRLSTAIQPDEPIILDLPSPEPFDYYVQQLGLDRDWPAPRWPVRPWGFPTPNERPVPRAAVLVQLTHDAPQHIWMISNRSSQPPALGPLAAHYRVASNEVWRSRGDTSDTLFGATGARDIRIRLLEASHTQAR